MLITREAPLHPILVHFTIGLVGASLMFELLARFFKSPSLGAAGWWTLAAAVPLTAVTVITGLMSRRRAAMAEGPALQYMRIHTALGATFYGTLIATGVWRWTFWSHTSMPSVAYLAALGAVVLLMTVQGFFGGELVYAFGVGIRHGYRRLPLHDSELR